MSSTYGETLKLSLFGQSHGPAVGMVLSGVPAGLPVDLAALQAFLRRRAPGQNGLVSPRQEGDTPEFLGGIVNGYTCGAPIAAVIPNEDARPQDYEALKNCPRPGHGDYPAQVKYRSFQDASGGGHLSGRLTAPLCVAGGLCLQWLAQKGVRVGAHLSVVAGIGDDPLFLDWENPDLDGISPDFPVLNPKAGEKMRRAVVKAQAEGDSVGGVIECAVTGLPVGLGEPVFGGMESRIAQIIYAIPAVKGLDFGSGFAGSYLRGSENNDPYVLKGGQIRTLHNRAGGILGGITNGMPLIFQVAVKPTPSIAKPQQTVDLERMEERTLTVPGRHDPCIALRAVPVVEAAAAVAVLDAFLSQPKW